MGIGRKLSGAAVGAALVAFVAGAGGVVAPASASATAAPKTVLAGRVLSGDRPLASRRVTLLRTASDGSSPPVSLGDTLTRANGTFKISYTAGGGSGAVFYVLVGEGADVRLASALGVEPVPHHVVVNERTTVAMGFALAEFVAAGEVAGRAPGPQNGAAMAGDLVDMRTGELSRVLAQKPNGKETSTLRAFNTLANMLVACVRDQDCAQLFALATPPGGSAPQGTLDAVADIARDPSHNVGALFALAGSGPVPYRPGLLQPPDAWTLALRFVGDGHSLNGPGNMAIDALGNVWVTNNYAYSRNPLASICGSNQLMKLTPTGRYVEGSPYTGGGLSGAGFGITLDPDGNVWVGNFGFASSKCPTQPPHASVSEFTAEGVPLSPDQTSSAPGGFTAGGISWPQGTVSDQQGNIWIANCGNDSVARYAGGDPSASTSFTGLGIEKPFDIAVNLQGQVFVTGNGSDNLAMMNPDGSAARPPITAPGLKKPLGIAADSQGNMWVANSGVIDVPCPNTQSSLVPQDGAITLIGSNGASASSYTGGGLTIPWGIAVDGNDNVWVANFFGKRLSEFCGTDTANCPPGTTTGQPISPATGFGFDGLVRNTGVQIDPSGNVWLANNWKTVPIPDANPGGYEMVAFIGLAGPLRTPLIGPPSHL